MLHTKLKAAKWVSLLSEAQEPWGQGKGITEIPTPLALYLYVEKDENNLARNTWKEPTDGHSKEAGMEQGVIKPRCYRISSKAGRTGEQGHQ